MIPHLEQYFGTYFPKGGMHQITLSLFELAKDLGVQFHFNSKVEEIIAANGKADGIKVNNEFLPFDIVVSNADVVPTYRKLLPKHKAPENPSQPRSSSALIFYWGIRHEFPQLDLHNIFFLKIIKLNLTLFLKKITSIRIQQCILISLPNKSQTDAPKGCENWFTMVNVPSNTGQDWDEIIARTRVNVIKK